MHITQEEYDRLSADAEEGRRLAALLAAPAKTAQQPTQADADQAAIIAAAGIAAVGDES